ncbi:MAG: helix-turn-helix domain-containing protein, partial [Anaerolineales bacterium]|nr:helix-turn-helix domain-containing protein [Anaerolineales bacterium]
MKQVSSTEQFKTFGQLLLFLRKRARFTQAELGRAVGYSREQISRLESDQRLPDVVAVRALFITALGLEEQPQLAQQLVQLAEQAHHATTDLPSAARRLVRKKLTQLPAPMFKLIGRVEELATVQTMMSQEVSRLYTLLGPPGVGKTRLALALGWHLQPLFEDGVVWVDLTAVSDAAAVATVIRQRLKLSEPTATTPTAELEQLAEGLEARHLLLILDNFEQLLEARLMLSDLLAAVVGLTVLITSRLPLHIYGEHKFYVEPFPVLTATPDTDLRAFQENPAVALFLARAQAVQPALQLTAVNAPLISAICARLDGLPLALELAAGQLQQQTLPELWEQLNLQPLMLNHGPLDRSQRQQSLRGAIAWSFTRLPDAQQQLFVRLAVFSGGFTKAAVEAVCQSEQLSELVDANLVQVKDEQLGMRHFGLLETIREFALERFLQTAEIDEIYKRHAEYILALTKAAREAYSTPALGDWQTRLLADYDNIVTALTWTYNHQPQLGLEICAHVWRFWYLWGRYKEGGRWLAQFLELMPASTLW